MPCRTRRTRNKEKCIHQESREKRISFFTALFLLHKTSPNVSGPRGTRGQDIETTTQQQEYQIILELSGEFPITEITFTRSSFLLSLVSPDHDAGFIFSMSAFRRIFHMPNLPLLAVPVSFKLKQADKLLQTTDKKLNEICDIIGYSDTTQFIRDFKQRYGNTPAKYRKAFQESH